MSAPAIFKTVRSVILAEWTVTPVGFPNGGWFLPGDPTNEDPEYTPEDFPASPWIYVEIHGAGAVRSPIGSRGKRLATDDGVVWGHCFVPSGTGAVAAEELARAFGEMLANRNLGGGIATEAPSVGVGDDADDEGSWFRVSVSIPYSAFYLA